MAGVAFLSAEGKHTINQFGVGDMRFHFWMPHTYGQMLCNPEDPIQNGTQIIGEVTCKRCWRVIKYANKNGNIPIQRPMPDKIWKELLSKALPQKGSRNEV